LIELAMVKRMVRRGVLLGPLAAGLLGLLGGIEYGISAAAGILLALANLWLAGRIIGGLAENHPELLLAGAFAAFFLGFVVLALGAIMLRRAGWIDFPVAGVSLIGTHLGLVTWEAADAFLKLPADDQQLPKSSESAGIRS